MLHKFPGFPLAGRPGHSRISVPHYDRSALSPAVVHLGVGNFHRAHQAVYFDDLAERGISTRWGIVGVGLHSGGLKRVLDRQDCLYTVVERDNDQERARVVGVMTRYLLGRDDPGTVLDVLADERTRIASMTITGAGYHLDPATGELDGAAPDVLADLANPLRPTSVFGYLAEALERRRRRGLPPFTVLSCDNLPDNGAVTRRALVSFAARRDPGLAEWIDEHGAFPGSMVDRITPGTSPAERERIRLDHGVDDRWPVTTEPYTQWVIEDRFCHGRPPLDRVGVQFVDDVGPYKVIKGRLLNGTHCALGYLGTLAGHQVTAEAMSDPLLCRYVTRLMRDEVSPLLPIPSGFDLPGYRGSVLRRLGNPSIQDRLARLCGRGSTKMPAYLLPSLREALAQGRGHVLLALALAAWLRYLRGVDLHGAAIKVEDANAARLRARARTGGSDPRPLLEMRDIFGDLRDHPHFVATVERLLAALDHQGLRPTMRACLGDGASEAA
jgi:fructuronate reductase/mannitol 2-dehydrogenase